MMCQQLSPPTPLGEAGLLGLYDYLSAALSGHRDLFFANVSHLQLIEPV